MTFDRSMLGTNSLLGGTGEISILVELVVCSGIFNKLLLIKVGSFKSLLPYSLWNEDTIVGIFLIASGLRW